MRIISQDGEFDLPYEETTLQAFYSGKVIAFPLSDLASDDFIPMATYSSKEKINQSYGNVQREVPFKNGVRWWL